jgi:hypothetical protein
LVQVSVRVVFVIALAARAEGAAATPSLRVTFEVVE